MKIKDFSPSAAISRISLIFTISIGAAMFASAAQAIGPVLNLRLQTNISISGAVKQTGAKRLGINISGQGSIDSTQMLRNLTFNNPGFEGETWQSILQCKTVTPTSCTDSNPYAVWPANFLQGAQFAFLSGPASGLAGVVSSSTASVYPNQGVTIYFAQPTRLPAPGDYVRVQVGVPGNAQAGWWSSTSGGATLSTEFADLSPNTPGKQALRMTAAASGQSASVASYFDGFPGRSFVQLKGAYQVSFRAKGVGGSNSLNMTLVRNIPGGNEVFINQAVALSTAWEDYTFTFQANENGSSVGGMGLTFNVAGASALLDDVSLTPATSSPGNPTAFRDEVVSTLQALHPGVLRYMDGGTGFGSSIDNMIAVPFARVRAGFSTQSVEQDQVPPGLHEFLELCQTVGAEPWYTMPPAISPVEMQNLIEYLAGDPSTPYGSKRATLGQTAPWTTVFPVIHLELGQEQWNSGANYGARISNPVVYGNRVSTIFSAARSSASYNPSSFDLVMGSLAASPAFTTMEMSSSANYDSVAVAPYLFNQLNDTSSNEAIFGPMFAEPESVDSVSSGYMAQQATGAAGGSGIQPAKLAVYQVQMNTLSGAAPQSAVNSVVPSVGAGIAVTEHMLLMMRDLGVTTQNLWALPGYETQFNNSGGGSEMAPLSGAVVDMGGTTNRRRPAFLAEQLANTAILPVMLTATSSGDNPTWSQPLSANNSIQLNGAHELQSFAFSDGGIQRSLIVFNLSRTTALPVTFSGINAPSGTVSVGQLTSANLTDSNETAANVHITNSTLQSFQSGSGYTFPAFSMTVFTWQVSPASQASPVIAWPAPAPVVHGATLSAAQLNATASVPGAFVYSPAIGTTPAVGTDTLRVIFIPTDTTDYTPATASVSLAVIKATPALAWTPPAPIAAGTAISSTQLNATASIPGTFTYNPPTGTVPPAGTDTLVATFAPTDSTNYAVANTSVHLTVNKASPVITWPSPAAITHGTLLSATQLNATASVPGTFAYNPVAGTTPAAGTDTLLVSFTPSDTNDYATATQSVLLVVNKATPVVTWTTPGRIAQGSALGASQLDASASVPGTFIYSPAAGTVPASGTDTLTVRFTPTDAVNYAAVSASVTIVVGQATPVIAWATPAPITHGTALGGTQLNATASVPGVFVYSPAAGTVPATGTDILAVTFTPSDTADYSTASASVSLVVNKAIPVVTWPVPLPIVLGNILSLLQLDATANVPGTFAYTPSPGAVLPSGSNTLSTTFTPSDSADYAPVGQSVSLMVLGSGNPQATNVAIGATVARSGIKRLGMNIEGQNYYDSGQMLRNLTFNNPGFEGETWQTILHCQTVTTTSCTDGNYYAAWPANFAQGASFEFIYGAAKGMTGTVYSSSAAFYPSQSITINFPSPAHLPAPGDFVVLKMTIPGNAQAGWWPSTAGGTLSTEFADLSPNTPGKQALRMTTTAVGQMASISSYFDSYAGGGHSFVKLSGTYQLFFRAKGVSGNNQMTIGFHRNTAAGNINFYYQTITLTSAWKDYTINLTANDPPGVVGTVGLGFSVFDGTSVLLDDVSLTPATTTPSNPTAFRDEVVSAIKTLNPGVLRYMDDGIDFGSSIDNMIAPPFARVRAGYSTEVSEWNTVPLGLHEFLQLCQNVGAEPWYTMPAGMSTTEMQNLMEYLAGPSTSTYGAKRAALGQSAPWTSVFPVIHLELGNEQWNSSVFYGAAMNDPVAFGNRISTIFGVARSSAYYNPSSFDLVMGSWAAIPWWTDQEMTNSSNYDTIAVAPYLYYQLNDASSNESIFGAMFAEPEAVDSSPVSYMALQAVSAAGGNGAQPAKLAIYETQLSTVSGTASQSAINTVVPSVAGGITVAEHMLLMIRDLGITTQNVWSLPGIANNFINTSGNGVTETTPLFGTVIDMGGSTNLRRPVFLGEQLANTAILPNMLTVTLTGANPTWNQPLSANNGVQLNGAHDLQTFAFSDGDVNRSLVLFNLSRTTPLPVTFSGANPPLGTVNVGVLTSANLTDSNENGSKVSIANSTLTNFQPGTAYTLPPFSMTVLTWQTP